MRSTITKTILFIFLCIFSFNIYAGSLREEVRFALKTNPRLLATESMRLATEQQVSAAKAGYLPTVDVSAAYGREASKSPTTIVLKPDDYTNLGRRESSVRINQNIFRGFFDENNILRSRHRLRSSAYQVQQEVQNIGLEAVEKYLEVLRISIVERLAQRNLDVHERIFTMIKKRSDKGLSRKADLEQARGRTSSAKARLFAEQGRLKDARTEYIQVVGRDPVALTAPPPLPQGALPSSEEIAVELAEKRNPALKAARAEVDAAVSRYKTAKSVNYPNFDFELSAKANYNVDGVRGNDKDYAALLRMNFNLFNGGGDKARIRETAHLLQQSYEIRNRTHRQVVEDMRLAWNALLTAQLRIDDLKSHKDSAWETVLAYRKQFQLGQRTLLDLLDAENEWFLSSVAYTNDKFNEFFAQYRILHSMGYLVQALRIAMPPEAFVREDVVTFIKPDADVPGIPSKSDAETAAAYHAKPKSTDEKKSSVKVKSAIYSKSPHKPLTKSIETKKSLRSRMVGVFNKHHSKRVEKNLPHKPLVRYVSSGAIIGNSVIDATKAESCHTITPNSKKSMHVATTKNIKSSVLYRQLQQLWHKNTGPGSKEVKVAQHHTKTTKKATVETTKTATQPRKRSAFIQHHTQSNSDTRPTQTSKAKRNHMNAESVRGYRKTANKWGVGSYEHQAMVKQQSMVDTKASSDNGQRVTEHIKHGLTDAVNKVQEYREEGKRFWQESADTKNVTAENLNQKAQKAREKTKAAVDHVAIKTKDTVNSTAKRAMDATKTTERKAVKMVKSTAKSVTSGFKRLFRTKKNVIDEKVELLEEEPGVSTLVA